jgi:3-deoxy-D-manno-octulosonic-acid transferase
MRVVRRKGYLKGFLERLGASKCLTMGHAVRGWQTEQLIHDRETKPPCFWLHAVSAGEVMAAMPLVKELRFRYPYCRIFFSTTTPAGRAILTNNEVGADCIFYSPLDVPVVVNRVVSRIAPTLFLLIETDIWPVLLHCLARRGVPSLLLNGRISLRRVRFRYVFRPIFRMLEYITVQTEVDAQRLIGMGVDFGKIAITGNMKFTQAVSQRASSSGSKQTIPMPDDVTVLIAGSTHAGEDEEILGCHEFLLKRHINLFLILAPRHVERVKMVERLVRARGFTPVRWSRFEQWSSHAIVLVDSVGILPRLYGIANFVFVGGSFVKRGGHNVLEPAAWGKPIFFGPHMENYSSIAETLEREGAAIRVKDGCDLAGHIEILMRDHSQAGTMGCRARTFVDKNQGSVQKNLELIDKVLSRDGNSAAIRLYRSKNSWFTVGLLAFSQAAWLIQSLQGVC